MNLQVPFYTDALAAAWMKRDFGMGYCNEEGKKIDFDYQKQVAFPVKLYVDSESMHILEPLVGDLLRGSNNMAAMYFTGITAPKENVVIVQRYGIPFIWPEFEKCTSPS